MIKRLYFILFIFFFNTSLFSQISIDFGLGYSFPIASLGYTKSNVYSNNGNRIIRDSGNYSYGKGKLYSFGIGYEMKKLIFNIEGSYLDGATFVKKAEYENQNTHQIVSSGKMLRISLLTGTTLQLTKSLNLFSCIGPSFGVYNKIHLTESSSDHSLNENLMIRDVYSGDLSYGVNFKTGLILKLFKNVKLVTSIDCFVQSLAPRKRKTVELTINGLDKLNELTESERVTIFKNQIVDGLQDSDRYSERLKVFYPFSSLGLSLRLQIKFDKLKKIKENVEK